MASSVARMPTDDWRDPNRLAAGVFGAHAHHPFGNNLRKVLIREVDRDPVSVTSSTSSSSTTMAVGGRDAVGPRKMTELSSAVGEDSGSPSTARKRQSQILDRWAARQAREMVTTIERQAHEAEISALTTTTQPVSTRAASFLRDSSPAFSDTSVATATVSAASASSSIDLPPNVRASSLIQMWRELEAEAGITPTNRTTSGGSNSAFASAAAAMAEEPSGGSDVCDDSEAFGDWDSDITVTTAHSSMSESERGRVGSIVKMLSSANATRSSTATSWSEEVEPLSRESSCVSDHGESQTQSLRSTGAGLRRVRGRREMEDLLAKLERERRSELSAVSERQPVSRFLHRGRLQVSCSIIKNDSKIDSLWHSRIFNIFDLFHVVLKEMSKQR
ncbi:putative E3 ubiquitin-protein ligase LUL3 [Cocos nucifera]|nr:putative E3 ubiquitin-protein ligase LUL3 [Cocos nucifera]